MFTVKGNRSIFDKNGLLYSPVIFNSLDFVSDFVKISHGQNTFYSNASKDINTNIGTVYLNFNTRKKHEIKIDDTLYVDFIPKPQTFIKSLTLLISQSQCIIEKDEIIKHLDKNTVYIDNDFYCMMVNEVYLEFLVSTETMGLIDENTKIEIVSHHQIKHKSLYYGKEMDFLFTHVFASRIYDKLENFTNATKYCNGFLLSGLKGVGKINFIKEMCLNFHIKDPEIINCSSLPLVLETGCGDSVSVVIFKNIELIKDFDCFNNLIYSFEGKNIVIIGTTSMPFSVCDNTTFLNLFDFGLRINLPSVDIIKNAYLSQKNIFDVDINFDTISKLSTNFTVSEINKTISMATSIAKSNSITFKNNAFEMTNTNFNITTDIFKEALGKINVKYASNYQCDCSVKYDSERYETESKSVYILCNKKVCKCGYFPPTHYTKIIRAIDMVNINRLCDKLTSIIYETEFLDKFTIVIYNVDIISSTPINHLLKILLLRKKGYILYTSSQKNDVFPDELFDEKEIWGGDSEV